MTCIHSIGTNDRNFDPDSAQGASRSRGICKMIFTVFPTFHLERMKMYASRSHQVQFLLSLRGDNGKFQGGTHIGVAYVAWRN